MRDQELVNALRCVSTTGGPMGDCKKCPFYKTEPVPEDLAGKVNLTEWSSCDVDAVGLAAADQLENQSAHIVALQQEIEKLRGSCPGGSRWRSGCRKIVAMSSLSRIGTKDGASIWAGALPKGRHGLSISALGTDPISPSRTGCRCRNRRRRKGK